MGIDDWVARALEDQNMAAEVIFSMRGHVVPPLPCSASSPVPSLPPIDPQPSRKRSRSRMITLVGLREARTKENNSEANRITRTTLGAFTEKGSTSSKRPSKRPKKECDRAPTLIEGGYCKGIANEPLKLRFKLPKPVLQQPGKRAHELNLPPLISSLHSKISMKPILSEMNQLPMVRSSGRRDGLILDLNELPPIEDDDIMVE